MSPIGSVAHLPNRVREDEMRKRFGSALIATAVVGVAFAAPASAATLADWEMNEAPGATVMVDSGPLHFNGVIGSGVQTGVSALGAEGYRWAFASPTAPPPKPERLVQVPNHSQLNPGSGNYTVEIRYRTTQHFGNMVQKGQAGSSGGYFKIENPGGRLNCVFRGKSSSGAFQRKAVQAPTVLSNGQWHDAVCARIGNKLTLTIDGKVVATASGSTGNISNTRPITIAGKLECDQVSTTCDYYTGDIDFIKITN
jgi:Concanavalin A-like lectin/glucanases superfamily